MFASTCVFKSYLIESISIEQICCMGKLFLDKIHKILSIFVPNPEKNNPFTIPDTPKVISNWLTKVLTLKPVLLMC